MSECMESILWIRKRGMKPQIRPISKLTDVFRLEAIEMFSIEMRLIQYQPKVQYKPNIVQSSLNRLKLH